MIIFLNCILLDFSTTESFLRLPIYIAVFGVLLGSTEGLVISTLVQYDQVSGKQSTQKHFPAEVQRLGFAELQESVYSLEPACLPLAVHSG